MSNIFRQVPINADIRKGDDSFLIDVLTVRAKNNKKEYEGPLYSRPHYEQLLTFRRNINHTRFPVRNKKN
jgi:hypothetical protein